MHATVSFCHPVLVSQCLQEGEDLEAVASGTVRFLVRALTPRN
jgi:hypothetical protein